MSKVLSTINNGTGSSSGGGITLEHLTIKQPPKTDYIVGDTFIKDGMIVEAYYSNGAYQEVTGYTYEPTRALTIDDTKITIAYSEGNRVCSIDQPITVKALSSLKIETPPSKIKYAVEDLFSTDGLVLEVYYSDESHEIVQDYDYTPKVALTEADKFITFTYSYKGNSVTVQQAIIVTSSQTFTIKIDQNNSNPDNCCTYADDASGMEKGSVAWDNMNIFKDIKPCVFKNGQVVYYLNPDNFNEKAEGGASNLTGTDGDVMIEFPKFGWKISTADNIVTVSITDKADSLDYKYSAFYRKSDKSYQDHFYAGAFKACNVSSVMHSYAKQSPVVNQSIEQFLTLAQKNGDNYTSTSWAQIIALQCLYLIKYGNLNGQAALGHGYVGGSSAQQTGATLDKGMYYGNKSSKTDRVKFAGLEDFWGNVYEFVNDLKSDASRNLIATLDGKDITYNSGLGSNSSGYITGVAGTSEAGFAPVKFNGSATTYYCDYGYLYASYIPGFGGSWDGDDNAGPFLLDVGDSASSSYSNVSSRLFYI